MSLFDPYVPPSPSAWTLDELEIQDVFTPLSEPTPMPAAPTRMPAGTSLEAVAVDAAVADQLGQMRARIEADAFARGRAAGMQESAESAREQLMRVLQALTEATASVHAHEQRWLGNVEENLAAAAVTIARHLIHRELTAEPTVITDLVRRSLQQFPLERNITVRLHPDDLAIVQQAMLDEPEGSAAQRDLRWHADPHIVRGGCLVDGRERVLDGRLDTALERTYRALGQVQA